MIYIYGISQFIVFFLNSLLAFMGIRELYGYKSVIFGFGEKNAAGYYLFTVSLIIFKLLKKKNKIYNLLFLIMVFLIEFFVINDRTIAFLMVIFYLLYVFNIYPKNIITKVFTSLLPIFLTLLSLFLIKHYGQYNWINEVNNLLSNRIELWNYFWQYYKPQIFPQSANLFSTNNLINLLPFDGVYASGLIRLGYILYLFIMLLQMYAIYHSSNLNNKQDDNFLFCVLICLSLYGFTEANAFNGVACFLVPYLISIFSYRDYKNNILERK